MEKEELFELWAPRGSPWAAWAKPVLFAHLPRPLLTVEVPPRDVSWAPPAAERWGIVVDLPGAESVAAGLALAAVGYRPVPVFNACPPPVEAAQWAVVDVDPILAALVHGAPRLQAGTLPENGPPRLLVEAQRQRGLQ